MANKILLVDCPQCEAYVNAEVLHSFQMWDENIGQPYLISFSKCPKCSNPFMTAQEDYGEGYDKDTPYRMYPSQDKRINPNFPIPIKNSYQEARACFRGKAYTATAIMCRKTLEGICVAHKIKFRNLAVGLKKMKEVGIIEKRLFDWAEALRIVGNEAAHDVEVTVSAEDAKDTLEFTDAILEYVFTYRDKFDEFLKRREKKKKKS